MSPAGKLNVGRREGETDARYYQRCEVEARAAQLVVDADALGFRVVIENKSDQPPAMRNYHPVIHVYESRN